MRKKLKLIATGSAALIWLIGLAGLPDDMRTWATEWLPMVADLPEKHVFDWEGLRCRINKALAERSRFIAGSSRSLVKRTLQRR